MSNESESESDERLSAHLAESFAALRAGDVRVAPEFSAMFAAARQQSADVATDQVVSPEHTYPHSYATPRTLRTQWQRVALLVGAPLLTAAGIGAVWLNAGRRAEREFEQTVMAWSETSRQSLRAPTDGLLSLPGDEYLRSTPTIGRGARSGS